MQQDMLNYSAKFISKLNTFCKSYLEDCLYHRKGFNVLYIIDKEQGKFGHFLSTCFEIAELVDPDSSREESVEKIVTVVDCSKFKHYDKEEINEMSYYLAYMLFGYLNGIKFYGEFKVDDSTRLFIEKSK